jgi:hypothetical protein
MLPALGSYCLSGDELDGSLASMISPRNPGAIWEWGMEMRKEEKGCGFRQAARWDPGRKMSGKSIATEG